jgi:hypothetical protein
MFEPLVFLSLLGGMVWMIAHAIFLLMRNDSRADLRRRKGDTMSRFVEENYGSQYVAGNLAQE